MATLTPLVASPTGHIAAHNAERAEIEAAKAAVAAAQLEIDLQTLAVFNVRAYGAKGDGTLAGGGTDDTAAFAACAAAMIAAGGGIFYIPRSNLGFYYKVTSLPNLPMPAGATSLPYTVIGDGSTLSKINLRGTSPAANLIVSNPAFDPSVASNGAAKWGGFTIDGTGSSGGCSGFQWGDISYPAFEDIIWRNFTTGDGLLFYNGYGWTEGVQLMNCRSEGNLNQVRFDVGSGRQLASVTTTIANGATAQTTIAVSALTEALFTGQQVVLAAGPSVQVTPAGTGGVATQTVTLTAGAAIGATSLTVTSFTATAAYTAGTAVVHFGGYGSFDYMTVHSLYLKPAANQHGWVSEVSRGLGQNIQRIGSKIRITGNSRNGTGNTGILMWLKGNDTYPDTDWDWTTETGGTGANHKSLQFDTSAGVLGGGGIFSMYGAETATFSGGTYQITFKGTVFNVKGVSDLTSSTTFRRFSVPGGLNIASGVGPSTGNYNPAWVSGTAYRNTLGVDVKVYVIVTFNASGGVCGWNTGLSGVAAPPTMWTGAPNQVVTMEFQHFQLSYAVLMYTNATITTVVRYCT